MTVVRQVGGSACRFVCPPASYPWLVLCKSFRLSLSLEQAGPSPCLGRRHYSCTAKHVSSKPISWLGDFNSHASHRQRPEEFASIAPLLIFCHWPKKLVWDAHRRFQSAVNVSTVEQPMYSGENTQVNDAVQLAVANENTYCSHVGIGQWTSLPYSMVENNKENEMWEDLEPNGRRNRLKFVFAYWFRGEVLPRHTHMVTGSLKPFIGYRVLRKNPYLLDFRLASKIPDRSRWLRTAFLSVPTLNCSSANTASEIGGMEVWNGLFLYPSGSFPFLRRYGNEATSPPPSHIPAITFQLKVLVLSACFRPRPTIMAPNILISNAPSGVQAVHGKLSTFESYAQDLLVCMVCIIPLQEYFLLCKLEDESLTRQVCTSTHQRTDKAHLNMSVRFQRRFRLARVILQTALRVTVPATGWDTAQCVYKIVTHTCSIITKALMREILPTPTEDTWKSIVNDFNAMWNFTNCLDALDGNSSKARWNNFTDNYGKSPSLPRFCHASCIPTYISSLVAFLLHPESRQYTGNRNAVFLADKVKLPHSGVKFTYMVVENPIRETTDRIRLSGNCYLFSSSVNDTQGPVRLTRKPEKSTASWDLPSPTLPSALREITEAVVPKTSVDPVINVFLNDNVLSNANGGSNLSVKKGVASLRCSSQWRNDAGSGIYRTVKFALMRNNNANFAFACLLLLAENLCGTPHRRFQPVVKGSTVEQPIYSGENTQDNDADKIDAQHVYTEVDFAIGSQFIRHALDDSEPIVDWKGNKGSTAQIYSPFTYPTRRVEFFGNIWKALINYASFNGAGQTGHLEYTMEPIHFTDSLSKTLDSAILCALEPQFIGRGSNFTSDMLAQGSVLGFQLIGPPFFSEKISGQLVLQNTRAKIHFTDWLSLTVRRCRCLPANHGHAVLELPNSDWLSLCTTRTQAYLRQGCPKFSVYREQPQAAASSHARMVVTAVNAACQAGCIVARGQLVVWPFTSLNWAGLARPDRTQCASEASSSRAIPQIRNYFPSIVTKFTGRMSLRAPDEIYAGKGGDFFCKADFKIAHFIKNFTNQVSHIDTEALRCTVPVTNIAYVQRNCDCGYVRCTLACLLPLTKNLCRTPHRRFQTVVNGSAVKQQICSGENTQVNDAVQLAVANENPNSSHLGIGQ
ncbi:hypothetical protein PR048_030589 [Dryococelus australis]|uniref:Uncharacterized protein n=1 Tax=Dryococelus australis TaxID=614101 RepID=A0ABQ9GC78_9NEOP|nr:hypothetical protein PR048_030589 [Dryococelus australis]